MARRRFESAYDLHNFYVDGDIFVSVPGPPGDKAVVSWTVEGNASFTLEVDIVEGSHALVIGIVPAEISVQEFMRRTAGNFADLAWYRLLVSAGKLAAFESTCNVTGLDLSGVRRIKLEYLAGEEPKLLYSINDRANVDVTGHLPKPLRQGDYKPCITTGRPSLRLRCTFNRRVHRRRLEGAAFAAKTSRALWEQRKYTDMAVITDEGRRIPCHRGQLAGGSPVFAAEFDRWAGDSPDVEVHGDGAAVEAMLEFLYTGELPASADVALVLTLAHRYQVDDLVSIAAERVLEVLTPDTAAVTARSLRPLRAEEGLREVWDEFCSRATSDKAIVEALALAT